MKKPRGIEQTRRMQNRMLAYWELSKQDLDSLILRGNWGVLGILVSQVTHQELECEIQLWFSP